MYKLNQASNRVLHTAVFLFSSILFALLAQTAAAQAVITVDDEGGGDFMTVAAALGAVSANDTIRITGGTDNIHQEANVALNNLVDNLTIEGDGNLTFNGNFTVNTNNQLTIQNIDFVYNAAISTADLFTNNLSGQAFGSISILNNTFTGYPYDSVKILRLNQDVAGDIDIHVIGNVVDGGDDVFYFRLRDNSSGSATFTAHDNSLSNFRGAGIYLNQMGGTSSCFGEIYNNTIANTDGISALAIACGLNTTDQTQYRRIYNNQGTNVLDDFILSEFGAGTVEILNNTIISATSDSDLVSVSAENGGTGKVVIAGNTLSNTTGFLNLIHIGQNQGTGTGGVQFVVRDNVLSGTRPGINIDTFGAFAIFDVVIEDNDFTGLTGTGDAVRVSYSTNNIEPSPTDIDVEFFNNAFGSEPLSLTCASDCNGIIKVPAAGNIQNYLTTNGNTFNNIASQVFVTGAAVNLNGSPLNAPAVVDDSAEVTAGGTVSIPLLDDDTVGSGSFTIQNTTSPTRNGGNITIDNATATSGNNTTYTADGSFSGDRFYYTVEDSSGFISAGRVDMSVAIPSCVDVTVTNQTQLNAALTDYNDNCGNGDTLTATVDGTITLASALTSINNATTAVLEIVGDGNDILDGADSFRILEITDGHLAIRDMTLQNGNVPGDGAAIRSVSGSVVTVANSTLSGNTATGNGGAIFRSGSSGSLTIINSTLYDNRANSVGGAITNLNSTTTVTNSTLSDNQAGANAGGSIYSQGVPTILNLNNTILANSTTDGSTATSDCFIDLATVNFSAGTSNLIEQDGPGLNACGTAGVDYINADPVLGALADNGGSVETMALGATSVAINAGNNSVTGLPATDATGATRIQDVNVDLGALETALTGCDDVTVANQFAIDAAIQDYNANCTAGQTKTVTVDGTITLISALTPINNATTAELVIEGDGDDILDGDDSFRILNIADGSVTLDTMTLQNGLSGGNGGAIRNTDILSVTNSTFTENEANNGGAILSNAQLSVTNSSFISNTAAETGGGIRVSGGTATIRDSTIANNTSFQSPAIQVQGAATADIVNSTIADNIATNAYGGIIMTGAGTIVTMTNTTVSSNTSPSISSAVFVFNGAVLNMNNSIFANTLIGWDCFNNGGTVNFSPGLSNLIENDGGNACGTAGTDYIEADPVLGALQNNGGDVETMALGAGSVAINAGDNTAATGLTTDARGAGFPRQIAGTVDLGAFENQQATSVEFASATDSGTESVANPTILTLTTSDGEVSAAAITVELAVSGGTLTDDYTVTNPFTIPAGTASGTPFAIPDFAIVDDSVEEANETLTLTLSNPSGATLGTQTTMDYTILDDDRVPPAPFTADVLSVVVVPLEDANNIGGIFYNFPATGGDVVLQGGQTNARVPVLSEILQASVPPGVGNIIGQTAWRTLPGTPPSTGNSVDNRVALYIDPNDLLGTAAFTVEDITSVEWRTNRQADSSGADVDWYALEYTAVTEGGSTLSRITAETLYSAGGNPPSNNGAWQTWDTTNVPLFEPVQANTSFGWFGNNVFQNDFFAGPIDWSLETDSGSSDTIDYRAEIINSIAVATASSWSDDLDGYIDYLVFNIDDGSTTYELIIDLEASPVPNEPTIEKTFGADTIEFGTTTALTFTLTNPNSSPLSGLAFTDTLPDNGGTGTMTFTSLTPTIDTCTTVRGDINVTAGEISLSDVYLGGGASCEIVLEVQASEVGTYVNTSSPLTTTTIGTAFGVGTDTAVATLEVVLTQTTTVAFAAAADSGPESVANPTLLAITTSDGQVTESDVTVELGITGGTVTEDYTMTTPFTIPAGTSPGTIAIPGFAIVDDAVQEPDETLTLTLSNPSGADLGAQITIEYTIENDDIGTYVTFLPIIMTPGYPDLIVENVTVSNTDITVVIRNIGSAPVTNGFYVDAYLGLLNPAQPPTGVNDIWQNLSPHGVVWGVDASMTPIAPGESVTLMLNDGYQLDAYTNFTLPLASGTAVYVQVDSAAVGNTNGGVLEQHETNGGSYNNIMGPVLIP